jgi:hypothetical protein
MSMCSPKSSAYESQMGIPAMRNLKLEIHGFQGFSKHFRRDSRLPATLQTDFCQAAHANKVVGGHCQQKPWSTRLIPRTITWRMQPTVLAQPKPCSMSLRLR